MLLCTMQTDVLKELLYALFPPIVGVLHCDWCTSFGATRPEM